MRNADRSGCRSTQDARAHCSHSGKCARTAQDISTGHVGSPLSFDGWLIALLFHCQSP
jgi:hypothetical protein